MTLSFGKPMVAIPGPSIMPDRVLAAMARPMPNIYAGELVEVSEEIFRRLPSLARTQTGRSFITISNGHGAWQMAISNTLCRGDKVLVLESGRFALGWGEMATMSGVEVEVLERDDRSAIDPEEVRARLEADVDHSFAAVLCVQTDTATSVRNDIAKVRQAITAANHPALFMVDCIASLGCERFEMDEWGVDITVAASQKGLMVPPGLGFVWASDKALAAHDALSDSAASNLKIGYLDWASRLEANLIYENYAGTPPVSHLLALLEAMNMISDEGGLNAVWQRHVVLAGAVRAAVEAWSTSGGIEFNIQNPDSRSNAVTTILTGSLDVEALTQICAEQAGLILGLGIGGFGGRAFRIGHMGHLNPPMILGTLATVEAALLTLKMPLGGSGVAAASAHIAEHLSTD